MSKFNETDHPTAIEFIEAAGDQDGAAFGDGAFLEFIKQLIEMFSTMSCLLGMSREAFAKALQDPSDKQERLLKRGAFKLAGTLNKQKRMRMRMRDRVRAARAATNGCLEVGAVLDSDEVEALYGDIQATK